MKGKQSRRRRRGLRALGVATGLTAACALTAAIAQRTPSAVSLAAVAVVGKDELDGGVRRMMMRGGMDFAVVDEASEFAVIYETGEVVETEWLSVWRTMCGPHQGRLNREELLAAAREMAETFEFGSGEDVLVIDKDGEVWDEEAMDEGGVAGGTFRVLFNVHGSVSASAQAGLQRAATYLTSQFSDPITIRINVKFENLGPDVLGTASSIYTTTSWNKARNSLKSGMDANDVIQNYLPTGSTIPVRYDGGSNTRTNESRVFWTRAAYRSTVGSLSGRVADLVFNSAIHWDFNPANGVSGTSFVDVVIHEIGHAMGFTSGADFLVNDMTVLDIFRFQRSDGNYDYNPDTLNEFKNRPRLVSFNSPNDDHICDVIAAEYRMSDGDPYQASHLREQANSLGQMDPALSIGETRWPNYFNHRDLALFDAIGWDR